MTANALASDREASLAAGMNDHIGKPFDLDQLVDLLLRHGRRTQPPLQADTAGAAATVPVAPAAPAAPEEEPALVQAAARAARVDLPAALRRLGGRRAVYARSLGSFVHELPTLAAALAGQAQAGDWAQAGRTLHTLKGLAATLGAQALADEVAAAERALAGDWPAPRAAATVQDVSEALLATVAPMSALHALLQPGAPGPLPASRPAADPAAFRRGLADLLGLLHAADMRATEVIDEVQALAPAEAGDALGPLQQAVGELDFERSAQLCQRLLDEVTP
jgi:HPt (histidine-containing phosphotransfer) domain-containing protein